MGDTRRSRIPRRPQAAVLALGLAVGAIAAGCGTSKNAGTASSGATQASTTQGATSQASTTTQPSTTPTKGAKSAKGKAQAQATPAAANADQAAILAQLPHLPYPQGSYALKVKISKASPSWAAVYIRARPGFESQVQPDSASFMKTGGQWKVHQAGNGGGCGVPAPVRAELHLKCY